MNYTLPRATSVYFINNTTVNNFDKVQLGTIAVANGKTLTMNRFFTGSAKIPTLLISDSATVNYTINLTSGFEQICHDVQVQNCTLQYTGSGGAQKSLVVLTHRNPFKNNIYNIGFRTRNQSPNGVAKNAPTLGLMPGGLSPMTMPANGLASDPTKLSNI